MCSYLQLGRVCLCVRVYVWAVFVLTALLCARVVCSGMLSGIAVSACERQSTMLSVQRHLAGQAGGTTHCCEEEEEEEVTNIASTPDHRHDNTDDNNTN